jgi:hypothetical protein
VAEGARLESVFTLIGNEGSNPSLSATKSSGYDANQNHKNSEKLRQLFTNCSANDGSGHCWFKTWPLDREFFNF